MAGPEGQLLLDRSVLQLASDTPWQQYVQAKSAGPWGKLSPACHVMLVEVHLGAHAAVVALLQARKAFQPRFFWPAALLMVTALMLLMPTSYNTAHAVPISNTEAEPKQVQPAVEPVAVTLYVMSQCPGMCCCNHIAVVVTACWQQQRPHARHGLLSVSNCAGPLALH